MSLSPIADRPPIRYADLSPTAQTRIRRELRLTYGYRRDWIVIAKPCGAGHMIDIRAAHWGKERLFPGWSPVTIPSEVWVGQHPAQPSMSEGSGDG